MTVASSLRIAVFVGQPGELDVQEHHNTLMMCYALIHAGVNVTFVADGKACDSWTLDALTRQEDKLNFVPDSCANISDEKFDFILLAPTTDWTLDFYEKSIDFARKTRARIALCVDASSFESNAPGMWSGWRGFVAEGGLVISSLRNSGKTLLDYYSTVVPDQVRFEVCAPPINSRIADQISQEENDGSIVVMFSPLDAADLLELEPTVFSDRTVCIVSNTPLDPDFLKTLRSGLEAVNSTVETYTAISEKERFRLLAKAQALLFPSRLEGFSYALVEAAYMGTEVACYDLPGQREVVGGIAHMAARDNPASLSRALSAALIASDKKRRIKLRDAVSEQVNLSAVAARLSEILLRSRESIPPLHHVPGVVIRRSHNAKTPNSLMDISPVLSPTVRSLYRMPNETLVLCVQFVASAAVQVRSITPGVVLSDIWVKQIATWEEQAVLQATALVSGMPNGTSIELELSDTNGQIVDTLTLHLEQAERAPKRWLRLRELWPAPSSTRVVLEATHGERVAFCCGGSEWIEASVIDGTISVNLPRPLASLDDLTLYVQEENGALTAFRGLPPLPAGLISEDETGPTRLARDNLMIAPVNNDDWRNGVLQHPRPPFGGGLYCRLQTPDQRLPKAGDWVQLPSERELTVENVVLEGEQVLLHFAEPLDPSTEGYPGHIMLADTGDWTAAPAPIKDDLLWKEGVWLGRGSAKGCGVFLADVRIKEARSDQVGAAWLSVLKSDGSESAMRSLYLFDGGGVAWLAEPLEDDESPAVLSVIRNAEAHGLVSCEDPRAAEARNYRDLAVTAQARIKPGDVIVINKTLVRVVDAVTSLPQATILHLDLAPPSAIQQLRFASHAESRLPGAAQMRHHSPVSATDIALPAALIDHFRKGRPAVIKTPSNDRPRVLFTSISQSQLSDQPDRIAADSFIAHLVKQGFDVDLLLVGQTEPARIRSLFGDRVRVFESNFPDWQAEATVNLRRKLRRDLQSVPASALEEPILKSLEHSASIYHPFFIVPDAAVRLARALYSANNYVSIVCDHIHMVRIPYEIAELRPLPPVAVLTHETVSRLTTRHGNTLIDTGYRFCTPEDERDALNAVSGALILASSDSDADYFRDIGVTNPITLCSYDCLEECSRYQTISRGFSARRVIFHADDAPMNQLAVRWFIDHCWGIVLTAVPEATLIICGAVCDHISTDGHNITSLGVVDRGELMKELSVSSVAMNPTLSGADSKAMAIQAACLGLPAVCLPAAVEGLRADAGRFCLTATDPASFADACIRLLSDRQMWNDLREDALNFASERFSRTSIYGLIDQHMRWSSGTDARWAMPRALETLEQNTRPMRRENGSSRRLELINELRALKEDVAAARLAESLLKEPEVDSDQLFNFADDAQISPMQLWTAAARRLAADPADASALKAQTLALARLSNPEATLAAWRQLALALPGSSLIGSLADSVRAESLVAAAEDIRRVNIPIALDVKRYIRDIIAPDERPGAGWSHMEHWGVWTDGYYARLDLSIPSTDASLVATLYVHSVPALGAPPLEVRIVVDGRDAGVFAIERRQEEHLIELNISGSQASHRNAVGIDFFISNPVCPRNDDGIVSDSRRLGLALNAIKVRQ